MDSPWKLLGTIAGCIAVDFGARFVWDLAKERGRQEAYEEMANSGAYVAPGESGEPVIIVVNGEKFYLKIEPVE